MTFIVTDISCSPLRKQNSGRGDGKGLGVIQSCSLDENDLLNAIESNDIGEVNRLLQQGAEVNMVDPKPVNPLMIACQIGNLSSAKLLVETCGADIYHALESKNCELDETLDFEDSSSDSDYDSMDFHNASDLSPLLQAVSNDDVESVEFHLLHGADVNERSSVCGDTALSMACSRNCIEVVTSLLKHGADANIGDKWGTTPLHLLANTGCEWDEDDCKIRRRMLKLLIEEGNADVNQVDNEYGRTPLSYACEVGNKCMVYLLLSHGADTEIMEKSSGRTALFSACEYEDIMALLISRGGANIHHMDDDGNTAMDVAMLEGCCESAKCLRIALLRSRKKNHN